MTEMKHFPEDCVQLAPEVQTTEMSDSNSLGLSIESDVHRPRHIPPREPIDTDFGMYGPLARSRAQDPSKVKSHYYSHRLGQVAIHLRLF